ncbi:MAG: hypothetical protein ACLGG8_08385 [Gammaproteobacteria bacterium]
MNTTTPAIVTQDAVRRLPRAVLLLFCLAYVLPGFVGREPWKTADLTAFGVMLDLAQGGNWWSPGVLGEPAEVPGWMAYWLGAWAIEALPFLNADTAARAPFIGLLFLTLACTWYSVYHLARQPAAQPVTLAFGGEASPRDYARTLADAALLALMACLGLAQLSHEGTPDLARLAGASAMFYGAAQLALPENRHPWRGILGWILGAVLLVFSGAPWLALTLGIGLLAGVTAGARMPVPASDWEAPPAADTRRWTVPLAAVSLAALLALAGWLGTLAPMMLPAMPLSFEEWQRWGRMVLWFTWPAWPLAVWTLWGWRRQWLRPHLLIPLWMSAVGLMASLTTNHLDRTLLLALPALATLAALALPTLRRSVSAFIDWFTPLFFSGCALIIWVIWFAMMTGFPAKPAANVAKLAPGFKPEFSLLLLCIGLASTLAWIWLVRWRAGRHRQALWKSLVLPAAGATLCWILLMSLWLPLLDFARSYGPLSRRMATLVPAGNCVVVDGLTQAQESALRYHGGLQLVRMGQPGQADCRALIVEPDRQDSLADRTNLTEWAFKATVRRLTDRKERLLLYLRVRPASVP